MKIQGQHKLERRLKPGKLIKDRMTIPGTDNYATPERLASIV